MKVSVWFLLPMLALLAILIACNTTKTLGDPGDVVFTHVNVLTMENDQVLPDQMVVVGRDGKIKEIAAAEGSRPADEGIELIDGKGQFLMPGISEMHAHIPVASEGNDSLVKETLFLYLSNGITLIRGMLGNPYHLELKKAVTAGDILSPRIYTSSPSLNGNTVPNKDSARIKVTRYQQEGYDFLKIHPGIQLGVMEELVKTAKEVGIPFSGHVPADVGVRNAIDFGYASIDHLDGYVIGLVPESAGVDPNTAGLFGSNFTNLTDTRLIAELVGKTKRANIWIVPTQSLLVTWSSPESGADLISRPEMQYVSGGTRFNWRGFKERILNPEGGYNRDTMARYIDIRNQLLKTMADEGVELLLGSDAPQVGNVPGFSIQHEMRAMSAAGISNYEILRSGTVNPARFFDDEGKYGILRTGASADLILLTANPLDDIRNMEKINGVMVRGQWLSRSALDEKLAEIGTRYAD